MLAKLITVPLPQPETVHSFAFRVIVAVDAIGVEYTPATQTLNERPTRFNVPAGIVAAINSWSVETFAFTVTGVTFALFHEPVKDVTPAPLFVANSGVTVTESNP